MNNNLAVDIGKSFFGGSGGIKDPGSISGFVTLFLNASFVIAGVILLFYFVMGGIAFLLIVYAGFMIMSSSGNPDRLKAGQELMTSAISGIVLLVLSIFVLRVIGVDILKIPGFN